MAAYITEHGAHDQELDKEKLRQLALYIASRNEDDPRFSHVKLNKILFYSDFLYYLKTGRSITGSVYIKMPYGPCPKDFRELAREMDEKDELKIQTRDFYKHTQKRPIALIPADLSVFTAEEIALVEEVLQVFWDRNAPEVSELSHQLGGWRLAEDKEEIPYSIARLGFDYELNEFHYDLAHKIAARISARQAA
jgi:hypothetical protein